MASRLAALFLAVVTLQAAASTARAAAAPAPSVFLRTSPDLADALTSAIRQQRPGTSVRSTGTPSAERDLLLALQSAAPEGWTLRIERGDGSLLLARAMPAGDDLASACALILDRFLEQPQFHRVEVLDLDTPALGPPRASPSRAWDWTLGVGAATAAGLDEARFGAGPMLELSVCRGALRLAASARAQFGAGRSVDFDDTAMHTKVSLGSVSVVPAALLLSAGICRGEGGLAGCLSVVAGPTAVWATSSGDGLYQKQTLFRPGLGAGLQLAASLELPYRLQGQLELLGLIRSAPDIAVDGIPDPVQRSPSYEIGLAFSIARHLR